MNKKRSRISKTVGLFGVGLLLWMALFGAMVACVSPEEMARRYPEYGSPAAQLYFARCSTCHSAPHPKRHKEAQWGFYVDLMQQHMQTRDIPVLTENEKKTLLDYLKRNAKP